MKKENKAIKFISIFLIIAIIAPAILFSAPKQARATVPVVDAANTSVSTLNKIISALNLSQSTLSTAQILKNAALEIARQAIMIIERKLLQKMTQAVVNWINTGFNGSPLFLTNPDSFFKDIGKYEIKSFVDLTGYDPTRFPFGEQFALNTINSYKKQFADNAQYSYSQLMRDPQLLSNLRNSFNVGGWNAFIINTQYPQNNVLGYRMIATEELARRLEGTTTNAAKKVQATLQQSMGFLTPQKCVDPGTKYNDVMANEFQRPTWNSSEYTKTHEYNPPTCNPGDPGYDDSFASGPTCNALTSYDTTYYAGLDSAKAEWAKTNTCKNLVATTPGSVVGDQIMTAMSSTFRQSELGAALGNSIGAILDALLNHFLDQGLTALKNVVTPAPPVDNWTYKGNTLTGGGTNVAATGTFSVSQQNISASAGSNTDIILSGGAGPYIIQPGTDASVARAVLNGSILTIVGMGAGSTSVTIKDSSSPAKIATVQITISSPGVLAINFDNPPTTMETVANTTGSTTNITLSGGSSPYVIDNGDIQIDSTVATAQILGNTLTISGVSPGKTFVVIKDSSVPGQPVIIQVTIDGGVNKPLVVASTISVDIGKTTTTTISGGTAPYIIAGGEDASVANIKIEGNTLSVTGVTRGKVSIIIKDSSSQTQLASLDVTVEDPNAILGTCLFAGTTTNDTTQSECLGIGGTWTPGR